jgi:spore coat polysaccharide biosynthesis predicted glycosyltransferase SpsG
MASLMLEADLFIGAGGTTTWERTKTGLPSIVISIAENQEEGCQTLHEAGIIHYLGKFENVDREQIRKTVQAIANDQELRKSFSSKSLELETGAGIREFCLEIQQS